MQHLLFAIFVQKTAGQKYFFQILSQENAQIVNLKNVPITVWILRFMIRFWICPAKKTQNPFLDLEIWIWIIPKKTHPLRS